MNAVIAIHIIHITLYLKLFIESKYAILDFIIISFLLKNFICENQKISFYCLTQTYDR